MLKIDFSNFYKDKDIKTNIWPLYDSKIKSLNKIFSNKSVSLSNMFGWITYPIQHDKNELRELTNLATSWQKNDKINYIVVVGNANTCSGIQAAIDMCIQPFLRKKKIIFVNNFSSSFLNPLINFLKKEDFYLVVASKSGTSFETNVCFRMFFDLLFQKFGSEAAKERILCITDKNNGVIRDIINAYNLKSFNAVNDIPNLFSAISPLGIFIMSYMGLNIDKLFEGAKAALKDTSNASLLKNTAYQYAVMRYHANTHLHKNVEVFGVYEQALNSFAIHWKHLVANCEGKENRGIFPVNALFTDDLYSIGQFVQSGNPISFETILTVKNPPYDIVIEPFMENKDGLDFIDNTTINNLNYSLAKLNSKKQCEEYGVRIINIEINKMDEYNFAYLYIWLAKSIIMTSLLFEVNPYEKWNIIEYKDKLSKMLKKEK